MNEDPLQPPEPAADPSSEGGSEAVSAEPVKNRAPIEEELYPRLRRTRVLVVDDSRVIRSLLVKTVASYALSVDAAENGRVGLAKLREAYKKDCPFQFVVSDVTMPEMTGVDMLREIRSDPLLQGTPVTIVSTENERQLIMDCAQLGIAGYLIKPFKTKPLLEAIEQGLSASTSVEKTSSVLLQELAAEVGAALQVSNGTPEHWVYVAVTEFLRRHGHTPS